MQPFNSRLNAAVLAIVRATLPQGFDVLAEAEAPNTFEELRAYHRRTGRVAVSDGASARTIYGKASVNFAFRAWHDSVHLRLGEDFSLAGETATAEEQAREIAAYAVDKAEARVFAAIIRAEVIGQAKHRDAHGAFPVEQADFVRAYLEQPSAALARAW